jgi:molybdate transport system ATP-binding protein
MMVITHDPADLALLGDEIFEIRDGMITPTPSART